MTIVCLYPVSVDCFILVVHRCWHISLKFPIDWVPSSSNFKTSLLFPCFPSVAPQLAGTPPPPHLPCSFPPPSPLCSGLSPLHAPAFPNLHSLYFIHFPLGMPGVCASLKAHTTGTMIYFYAPSTSPCLTVGIGPHLQHVSPPPPIPFSWVLQFL